MLSSPDKLLSGSLAETLQAFWKNNLSQAGRRVGAGSRPVRGGALKNAVRCTALHGMGRAGSGAGQGGLSSASGGHRVPAKTVLLGTGRELLGEPSYCVGRIVLA